jgi:hypothetical protein
MIEIFFHQAFTIYNIGFYYQDLYTHHYTRQIANKQNIKYLCRKIRTLMQDLKNSFLILTIHISRNTFWGNCHTKDNFLLKKLEMMKVLKKFEELA